MIKDLIVIAILFISTLSFSQTTNSSPYSLFGIGDQANLKTVEEIANDIKSDPEWFAIIQQKAEELEISVDEMLARDAQYIYNLENGIEVVDEEVHEEEAKKTVEDFEAIIRADENWMKMEQEKASERGITLDEMIQIDSEYLFSEQEKSLDAETTVEVQK